MADVRSVLGVWIFGVAAGIAVASNAAAAPSETEITARTRQDVTFLIAHPSADNLAAAAWMTRFSGLEKSIGDQQALDLIEQSEGLAPARPELVWVHIAICEMQHCEKIERLESRLKDIDSGNGFAWIPDLVRAAAAGSDADVTTAVERIGALSLTLYWNQRVVMMANALAAANPQLPMSERGLAAFGMAGSILFPPFQPITRACRAEQLTDGGRKAACERLMARMEASDTFIVQSLALSVQERWWPAGSPQRVALKAKHRRLDYLMLTSGRLRWFHMNHDMALRIEAARRDESEKDVARSMVKAFGYPEEPPERWKDTLRPG